MQNVTSDFRSNDRVVERLGDTLQAEVLLAVTERKALSVDGADGHSPSVWALAGKLRNVRGNLTLVDRTARFEHLFDDLSELKPRRDNQLVTKGSRDQDRTRKDYPRVQKSNFKRSCPNLLFELLLRHSPLTGVLVLLVVLLHAVKHLL